MDVLERCGSAAIAGLRWLRSKALPGDPTRPAAAEP